MGRSPYCDASGLKKGPWTPEEDRKLLAYIQRHGHGSWHYLPEKAGLQRCGKSCRLRWTNYLRPDIKRGKFSVHEEQTIIQLHALLGNRWSAIAAHLPKRTDNEIKNYWNTHIKKRLAMMGIDPVTHRPKIATLGAADSDPKNASNLRHMAQWESARLEAEARLVKESKARHNAPTSDHSSCSHSGSTHSVNKMANRPRCLDVVKAWQNVCFKSFESSIGTFNSNGSKTAVFGHGFYSVSDHLDSPTSILQFSDQTQAPLSSILSFDHSDRKFSTYAGDISEGYFNKFNNPDMMVDEAPAGEAWKTFGSSNTGDDNFLGGFSSLLNNNDDNKNITGSTSMINVHNIIATGSGHIGEESEEESKNYWNDLINLVDCGVLSSLSPAYLLTHE